MLSEMSDRGRQIPCYHLHVESRKKNKMNVHNKTNRLTNTEDKAAATTEKREVGRDEIGVWD